MRRNFGTRAEHHDEWGIAEQGFDRAFNARSTTSTLLRIITHTYVYICAHALLVIIDRESQRGKKSEWQTSLFFLPLSFSCLRADYSLRRFHTCVNWHSFHFFLLFFQSLRLGRCYWDFNLSATEHHCVVTFWTIRHCSGTLVSQSKRTVYTVHLVFFFQILCMIIHFLNFKILFYSEFIPTRLR